LGQERQAARRPRRHCEVRFDSALGLRLAADLGLELEADQDDAAATIDGRRRQVHHLFPTRYAIWACFSIRYPTKALVFSIDYVT
jgi:hypothetical protein